MILCDPSAERAILSGILKYGEDAYLDIADIIQESSFTIDSNQIIFKCLKNICEKESKPNIDIASVYSSAQELNLSHILSKKEETQHLKAIFDFPVHLENIRKFASKIKKLEIARLLHKEMDDVQEKLLDVTGSESISTILGIAEEKIFNFTKKKKIVRPFLSKITQDAKIVDSINSKSSLKYLKKMKFDLGLLAGVGILSNETLKTFKKFCLNAHPAPLPECRGGGALINTLAQNLVPAASVHIVREGIDAGEILQVAPLKLNKKDCFNSIESRLAIHCAENLSNVVKKIISGKKYKAKKNSGKLHQWKDCTVDKQRTALFNLKKLLKKI